MSTEATLDFTSLGLLKELSKSLVKGCKLKTEDDLYGKNGIVPLLQKELYQAMLEGELNHHLGYDKHGDSKGDNYRNGYSDKTLKTQHGEISIEVPRDRAGSFEPVIVAKHQRRGTVVDNAVISLYSKGMSLNQIADHIRDLYQIEMSDEQISSITETVTDEVSKWQSRALSSIYPIVYMDGIYINVLENKTVIKKVVYVALGVNVKGQKELLGLWISESEGSKFWLNVLTELNNRGLKQICIACVDGLTGFPEAIHAIYPKAMVQQCIVHAVRRSLDYVSYKDRKAFAADMKKVYGAKTIDAAADALDDLELIWGDKYPASIRLWRERWQYLTGFFQFPDYIRKAIYTTNAIESVNSSIRKIIKNKKSFPNDQAAFKLLYLALSECSKKWTMPIRDWASALNQLVIHFDLNMSEINKIAVQ